MTERLGRYALVRPLASGGMGEVLLAEHTGLSGFSKRVALKRIRTELARSNAYVEFFLNEARIGSFLNHPNIVHIFDVGHEADQLWLVMEYVDGVDLKRLIRRARLAGQTLSASSIGAIAVDILSALSEAHSGGPQHGEPIIHRDISPENIVICRSGTVKVLDFGLAKWRPGQGAVSARDGDLIYGKTRYMPPEQLKGALIDPRTDLFALGVLMYEAITAELPFGRGSATEILGAILAKPDLDHPALSADPKLRAIVLKALEARPEDRFQDAGEMRETLVAYLLQTSAALPKEALRRLLRRGKNHPLPGATEDSSDGQTATEIGLQVARRCGKCGGPFVALFQDGMIADACDGCHGVWLDRSELDRLLGSARRNEGTDALQERAPMDKVTGSCPHCRCGLQAYAVPHHPAALEVCPSCVGVWFDEGEFELLQSYDVATWLRVLVGSISAVAAGSPETPKR